MVIGQRKSWGTHVLENTGTWEYKYCVTKSTAEHWYFGTHVLENTDTGEYKYCETKSTVEHRYWRT